MGQGARAGEHRPEGQAKGPEVGERGWGGRRAFSQPREQGRQRSMASPEAWPALQEAGTWGGLARARPAAHTCHVRLRAHLEPLLLPAPAHPLHGAGCLIPAANITIPKVPCGPGPPYAHPHPRPSPGHDLPPPFTRLYLSQPQPRGPGGLALGLCQAVPAPRSPLPPTTCRKAASPSYPRHNQLQQETLPALCPPEPAWRDGRARPAPAGHPRCYAA